jgi:hypothetical protein
MPTRVPPCDSARVGNNAKQYVYVASCIDLQSRTVVVAGSQTLVRIADERADLITLFYVTQTPSPPDHSNITNLKGHNQIRDKPHVLLDPKGLAVALSEFCRRNSLHPRTPFASCRVSHSRDPPIHQPARRRAFCSNAPELS